MPEHKENVTGADNEKERRTDNAQQRPVTPLDMMIAKFQIWVEKVEKQRVEAREQASIPEDIPRYITRSS